VGKVHRVDFNKNEKGNTYAFVHLAHWYETDIAYAVYNEIIERGSTRIYYYPDRYFIVRQMKCEPVPDTLLNIHQVASILTEYDTRISALDKRIMDTAARLADFVDEEDTARTESNVGKFLPGWQFPKDCGDHKSAYAELWDGPGPIASHTGKKIVLAALPAGDNYKPDPNSLHATKAPLIMEPMHFKITNIELPEVCAMIGQFWSMCIDNVLSDGVTIVRDPHIASFTINDTKYDRSYKIKVYTFDKDVLVGFNIIREETKSLGPAGRIRVMFDAMRTLEENRPGLLPQDYTRIMVNIPMEMSEDIACGDFNIDARKYMNVRFYSDTFNRLSTFEGFDALVPKADRMNGNNSLETYVVPFFRDSVDNRTVYYSPNDSTTTLCRIAQMLREIQRICHLNKNTDFRFTRVHGESTLSVNTGGHRPGSYIRFRVYNLPGDKNITYQSKSVVSAELVNNSPNLQNKDKLEFLSICAKVKWWVTMILPTVSSYDYTAIRLQPPYFLSEMQKTEYSHFEMLGFRGTTMADLDYSLFSGKWTPEEIDEAANAYDEDDLEDQDYSGEDAWAR